MANRESMMEYRRCELLADVHAHVRVIATDHGVDESVADQLGCAVADHLAESWGGMNFTIPKDHSYKLSARDLEIWEQFDGRNHHTLAKRHGLTVRAIYKIIKRVRANGDPNQAGLF